MSSVTHTDVRPANQPPTVSLTSPTDGSSVPEGQAIALAADVADSDGSVAQVAFYDGTKLIAVAQAAPYATNWMHATTGSHTVTAKATDDQGSNTTSAPVRISVTEAPATTLYYIEPDHLGTPRNVTDETGKTVWRWVNLEPFGDSAPETDPDGDGKAFEFNLRFPGQYYDQESGMHYNYYRDYDPRVGRYVESDPIGLAGGVSLYGYADQNPLSYSDPLGLAPDGQYCGNCAPGAYDCLLYEGNACKPYLCCDEEKIAKECGFGIVAGVGSDCGACLSSPNKLSCLQCVGSLIGSGDCVQKYCKKSSAPCPKKPQKCE